MVIENADTSAQMGRNYLRGNKNAERCFLSFANLLRENSCVQVTPLTLPHLQARVWWFSFMHLGQAPTCRRNQYRHLVSIQQIDKENTLAGNLEPGVRLTIEAPRFCTEFGYYTLSCRRLDLFLRGFVLKSGKISSSRTPETISSDDAVSQRRHNAVAPFVSVWN